MKRINPLSHNTRVIFFFLTTLTLLSGPSFASEQVSYIKAGHLLDVQSGRLLAKQVILIKNGIIEKISPEAKLPKPNNATLIDLGEQFILPGLIDAHTHLTGDHTLHGYKRLTISTQRSSIYGVVNAAKTIKAGFTTVRNLGAPAYADIALRDSINAEQIIGPRMIASGPSIGITGGHCDSNLLPHEYRSRSQGVADGPWAVRAKVREVIKYGADVIKFCGTGGVLSKGTRIGAQQYTFEEMQALVNEAHALGRKVAVHAHGTEGIKTAIKAGVDSVEHASLIDQEGIKLAKQHNTALVMDIYVTDFILSKGIENGILPESLEKEKTVGSKQRENFRRAHHAGVKIIFGSDAAVYPHGDNAKQFKHMVQYGMTPLQAVQAATLHAANLLGLEDKIGTLKVGAYADLIAVKKNPLETVEALENVSFVMKNGAIIKHDD